MSRVAEEHYGDSPAPYPKSPGFKEPTTSRDAARKFRAHAHALSGEVFAAIAGAPEGLTADQVAEQLNQNVLAVRPRVSELRAEEKIEPVPGVRRKNASGMSAIVWRKRL